MSKSFRYGYNIHTCIDKKTKEYQDKRNKLKNDFNKALKEKDRLKGSRAYEEEVKKLNELYKTSDKTIFNLRKK